MKILYIDRERLARRQPCVAIRDEQGDIQHDDEVFGFGFYRMRAPHGEPLTPTGPAAWVEIFNLLTLRNVVLASLAIWGLVVWAIVRWVA